MMPKKFFIFSTFVLLGHVAFAQTCAEIFIERSEAVLEFKSLVDANSQSDFVVQMARRIDEKYKLSLDEFLAIANWGPEQNFSSGIVAQKLEAYSDIEPITIQQFAQLSVKYPADYGILGRLTAASFSSSTGGRAVILEIHFAGEKADFVKILIDSFKNLSAEQSVQFFGQIFNDAFRQNLSTFQLKGNDVAELLGRLHPTSLNLSVLRDIRDSIGLEELAKIPGDLLLSRLNLHETSEQLAEVLLTYNVNYLKKLSDKRQFPNLPGELLADIYLLKKDTVDSVGSSGESIGRDLFAKMASLNLKPSRGDSVLMYHEAQDIARLVLDGEVKLEVVEAFVDFIYSLQKTGLIYEYEFTPQMAEFFITRQLPLVERVDEVEMAYFLSKYVEVYNRPNFIPLFDNLYIYPNSLVTGAVIQAGLDLFKIEKQLGPIRKSDIEMYFDLRIGRVYPQNPNFWERMFYKPMNRMDHRDALDYVRAHLGQTYIVNEDDI